MTARGRVRFPGEIPQRGHRRRLPGPQPGRIAVCRRQPDARTRAAQRWDFSRSVSSSARPAILKKHGIPLDPRALVSSLPFAYRQMTEICKALMGDVRILILDEPTSALTGDEEQILFDAIRTVTERGVGVIYVTHRLNEVFRISQRVTVFRDGLNAGIFATAETNMKQLVAAIVGPGHSLSQVEKQPRWDGAQTGFSARERGAAPRPDSRVVRGHQRPAARCRSRASQGRDSRAGRPGRQRPHRNAANDFRAPAHGGGESVDGESLGKHAPAEAIELGIALVPEDRQVQGLILEHSIERNLTLPRLPHFSRWGWLRIAPRFNRRRRR